LMIKDGMPSAYKMNLFLTLGSNAVAKISFGFSSSAINYIPFFIINIKILNLFDLL